MNWIYAGMKKEDSGFFWYEFKANGLDWGMGWVTTDASMNALLHIPMATKYTRGPLY
jgi:hypothetical protein